VVRGIDLNLLAKKDSYDVIHICYGYSDRFIENTIYYITMYEPELTVINSTVLPYTTEIINKATEKDRLVVHSPVRGMHHGDLTEMVEHIQRFTKFVGADDKNALEMAERHFIDAGLKVKGYIPSVTTEFMKLFATTEYGLRIAYAQQIYKVCKERGLRYEDMVEFWKEHRVVYGADKYGDKGLKPIMEPGFIGGECVIPNVKLLLEEVPEMLFLKDILRSNEETKELFEKSRS